MSTCHDPEPRPGPAPGDACGRATTTRPTCRPNRRIPVSIPKRYAVVVSTEQIAVRVPEGQLAVLDDLVQRGIYESRAAAVRAGIDALVELDRRRSIDHAIIDGYQRVPPTEVEDRAAIASLADAIAEEPW